MSRLRIVAYEQRCKNYIVLQYIAIKYNYYIYLVGAKIQYIYWSKANLVRAIQYIAQKILKNRNKISFNMHFERTSSERLLREKYTKLFAMHNYHGCLS